MTSGAPSPCGAADLLRLEGCFVKVTIPSFEKVNRRRFPSDYKNIERLGEETFLPEVPLLSRQEMAEPSC